MITTRAVAAGKVRDVLCSPGRPLDSASRAYFEPRFGFDFSRVRIHSGPHAAASAHAVRALAYAANRHIVLGADAPAVHSPAGRELMAHELAHVIQQSSRPSAVFSGLRDGFTVRPARDRFEQDADQTAARALGLSPRPGVLQKLSECDGPLVIQRQPPYRDFDDPMFRDDLRPPGFRGRLPVYTREDRLHDEELQAKRDKDKEEKEKEANELRTQGLDRDLKLAILNGEYKDAGEYKDDDNGNFQFTNPKLQRALRYYILVWAPTVPVIGTPPSGIISDSHAKPIPQHPQWVKEFTIQLMGQQPLPAPGERAPALSPKLPPQWNQDSRIVQRLIEAYLRAWDMKINNRYYVNANLAQLYANVGGSITNDRAELFGGIRDWGNWCGPASQNAVALGLMQGGYRFKQQGQPGTAPAIAGNPHSFKLTLARPHKPEDDKNEQTKLAYQKEIATAFQVEVRKQGAFFLTNWAKEKDLQGKKKAPDQTKRTIFGKAASTEKLFPGDFIYIINGNQGSPLSGHVATVIREEPLSGIELGTGKTDYKGGTLLSKLYWISGNAKGVVSYEGSIRPELVDREMPHKDYSYSETSGWGNQFDQRKTVEKNIERKGRNLFDGKLQTAFSKVLNVILTQRRKNPATSKDISDKLEHKAEGEYFIVYKYDAAKMKALFNAFGVDFQPYQDLLDQRNKEIVPDLTAAQAVTNAYVEERVKANQPYTTKSDYDSTFEERNKREKGTEDTGRYKPLIDHHSWVVSIVRASQLDPSRLRKEMSEQIQFQNRYTAGAPGGSPVNDYSGADMTRIAAAIKQRQQVEQQVLDKYGLEPMPGTIEELWPGAVEFWEARGAFK